MPAEKVAGSPVYAVSINQFGAIEIRAERIGRDTSYGKIIEAVERAERLPSGSSSNVSGLDGLVSDAKTCTVRTSEGRR